MKKNILKATLVVAFALIAGMNVYNAQQSDVMSDLALANVEALASGESSTTNRYQTMGYCAPLNMNYMCTSRRTAESCRRPCHKEFIYVSDISEDLLLDFRKYRLLAKTERYSISCQYSYRFFASPISTFACISR